MTLPIARDLASEGIRVNTILPGIFDTPLMRGAPEAVKAALAASVPFPKRLGSAEDYASLALEMVRNSYFNGEDVRLDGAIRMAPR
jgi:NAD(P)-dependent dehydrogenase (short-subunit alcohol dehydrogenase family)